MTSSESLASTHEFYGHWAQLYDIVATAPGVQSWREQTVETLNLSDGETVVEMGCGTGANFPFLRDAVGPTGQVVGIDLVPAMLGEARDRINRASWENVHVVRGDATQPPVGTVDAILSTFLVGMLDNPGDVMWTWVTQLRSGGRLTILNASRTDRLLARPLNLPLRLFVRFAAAGNRARPDSPVRLLEGKFEDAREALFEGTVDQIDDRLGAGFVTLASGRRP